MDKKEYQIKIFSEWSDKIIEKANTTGGLVLRFILVYPLQEKNNLAYVKDWIHNAQVYMTNYNLHKGNDIRKYLCYRNKN